MSGKVLELEQFIQKNELACAIAEKYNNWQTLRQPWLDEKREARNYIFATDTTKTSNRTLPWKNSTTIPKLTQIRDNLHANYMSALFPNDDWLRWEAYTAEDAELVKKEAIQAYMSNKVREGGFKETVSELLYDYIDWGMPIADSEYVDESKVDPETGETIRGFVGPRAVRISPVDVVLNPSAARWKDTPKITRYIKTLGELKLEAMDHPELSYNLDVINLVEEQRKTILQSASSEEINKIDAYQVDGFGSLYDYYTSNYVEIIEFEGTVHDPESGELLVDHIITVIDRIEVVRKIPNPAWRLGSGKVSCQWRKRPDNLYPMGPLDNLVGMQYRLDHLENIKADALDLTIHPPLMVRGNVEEFVWAPGEEIYVGEDGDVQLQRIDGHALTANNEIAYLQATMEEMAGAPRQSLGVRTPGEKTAFEVQTLENNAGRIFQEKIAVFESQVLEPLLNNMLELARRRLDGNDIVRISDDDLAFDKFITITKEDITGKGKLRPVGAKHFAARAQMIQNMTGIFNSPIGQMIAPHVSSVALAKLVEDQFGIARHGLIQTNIAIIEQGDTQRIAQQVQEDVTVEGETPLEEEEEDFE